MFICSLCGKASTVMVDPATYDNLYLCEACRDRQTDHPKPNQENKETQNAPLRYSNPMSVPETVGDTAVVLHGVGPDAPTTTNKKGGSQSYLPYRCDLLPAKAIMDVSRVLKDGAEKYGEDNWRLIHRMDHINHALAHLLAYVAGDQTDEHLSHAACRVLFAIETKEANKA